MMTHMALDHWGLSLERDKIQIRVIGDDSVLAQAVMTGAVDGAVLGYTFSRVIPRSGGRILAELPKLNVPYQGTGLVARRSFIDSSPDTVEKTLKALIRANRFIQDKSNQPAYIHCGGGGRAASMWMIKRALKDGWTTDRAAEEANAIAPLSPALKTFATNYIAAHK